MTGRPARRLAIAATVALVAIVVGGAACTRRTPRAHTVAIRDFAFVPATVTVAPGDTIVWTNGDFVPHTATARDGRWDSKAMAAGGGTWRLVARTPGRHAYYCVSHPNMQGVVEVR